MDKKSIGKRIKFARKQAGLTQAELAEKMGCTRQTVGTWERGEVTPSIQTIMKIQDVLSVTNNEILGKDADGLLNFLNGTFEPLYQYLNFCGYEVFSRSVDEEGHERYEKMSAKQFSDALTLLLYRDSVGKFDGIYISKQGSWPYLEVDENRFSKLDTAITWLVEGNMKELFDTWQSMNRAYENANIEGGNSSNLRFLG